MILPSIQRYFLWLLFFFSTISSYSEEAGEIESQLANTPLPVLEQPVDPSPLKVIAIVRDADSNFFSRIVELFQEELTELSSGDYDFIIKDEFNAKGDPKQVKPNVLKALRDPEVDVVYTAGILASAIAQALPSEERLKPLMAGAIEFSNFNNEGVSQQGTSAIPNFTFIMESRRVPEDLQALARLTGKKKVYSLVDQSLTKNLQGDTLKRVKRLEEKSGLDLTLIPVGSTADSCIKALPTEASSVYVPILPSLKKGERAKLFQALNDRGVLGFSMTGAADIKLGAVASLSPENSQAFFRRTALNLHQMLSGVPTSLLPVVLVSNDQLKINMQSAKRVGLELDYDTLLEAELINADLTKNPGESLSLEKAMKLAESHNVDIEATKQRWLASYWETQSLKTARNPQFQINGQWNHTGIADRINTLGAANTDSAYLGAQISQLLYSDRVTSQIRAQREVESATKFDLESTKLDIISAAGTAFLDYLLADALYQVEKQNLTLASQNRNLSQTRIDIGAAEPAEVYRWKASLAQTKAQLIRRDIDRKNALLALNVSISHPQTKHWRFEDISLTDEDFYFMNAALQRHVNSQQKFDIYTQFLKSLSIWNSPELKAFENNLKAQGIILSERGRRNTRPEISLTATARHSLSEIAQDYDNQTEWTVGIGFTMPLFEGGLKHTESQRIQSVIAQLKAQRDKASYQIEQQALSSVYLSSASHPTFRLSRIAVDASEKNYQSVKSKYSQGAASVVDLLDAQSQLISQQQSEVSAKYQYLKDIIAIQRSIAWFEYSKSPQEKRLWENKLANFMKTGSIHIKTLNPSK